MIYVTGAWLMHNLNKFELHYIHKLFLLLAFELQYMYKAVAAAILFHYLHHITALVFERFPMSTGLGAV